MRRSPARSSLHLAHRQGKRLPGRYSVEFREVSDRSQRAPDLPLPVGSKTHGSDLFAGFGRGSIEFLHPANHRVLAYVRQLKAETVLVVNNLSNSAQAVELDLRRYKGNILVEMFGRNIFPRIGDLPYLLTMAPYQFFWFRLRRI